MLNVQRGGTCRRLNLRLRADASPGGGTQLSWFAWSSSPWRTWRWQRTWALKGFPFSRSFYRWASQLTVRLEGAEKKGGLSYAFSASASFLFFLCICVIKCSLHCVFNLLEINLWKLLESETNNNFHIHHKIDCSMLLFRRYVTFLESLPDPPYGLLVMLHFSFNNWIVIEKFSVSVGFS